MVKKSSSVNSDGGHDTLAGAKFTLESENAEYHGTSGNDGVVTWYDSNNQEVKIPNGVYTLTEVEAPNGYELSEESCQITVNDNSIAATMQSEYSASETVKTETTTVNGVTKKTVTLTFYDAVLYTLPETGGSGVYVYTLGGILLMMAGALMLYKNNKKKNK